MNDIKLRWIHEIEIVFNIFTHLYSVLRNGSFLLLSSMSLFSFESSCIRVDFDNTPDILMARLTFSTLDVLSFDFSRSLNVEDMDSSNSVTVLKRLLD